MKEWFVGEKAVSLLLGGPLPVAIGVRPRRGAPLFHTLLCCCRRVPDCPELAGLPVLEVGGKGGLLADEGGRWLIGTAHALE